MRKIFGTDGVRARANTHPMTPDIIMKLAIAAGLRFTRGDYRHMVVIGKDTRLSGYMVESALTSGFVSVGMDVTLVGPLPTPAIAMLTRSLRADMGVVISASHNPYEDNGIKFFGPDGHKLSDNDEAQLEQNIITQCSATLASPNNLGRARRLDDAQGRYIEHVKNTFPKNLRLDGLKIVIDCANGAAYQVAPAVLWELGAEIICIGVDPDGFNINQGCGATVPDSMQKAVLEHKADLGIALDGDADRVIMADEKGKLINGDQILSLIAIHWQKTNRLHSQTIVGTVMSNLGMERYLTAQGLNLHRTPVGDRYIAEYMRQNQCNVGGEQSGHTILKDYATTGDGLIAALQVLAFLVEAKKPVSEIAHPFSPTPQILHNIQFSGLNPLEHPSVINSLNKLTTEFKTKGRLLIRKSGTESLVRIMAEGEDLSELHQVVQEASQAVTQHLAETEQVA
ncbi:MAG: phosphoglucosamine mutase [Pseudomonadota bacterium]